VDRFIKRLQQHAASPRWEAVVGYHDTDPIGYAYGAARPATTGYWATLTPPPDDNFAHEDGERTFVLFEFMILPDWRGTGASRVVHDALLAGRPEPRVSLAVENDHPRVRALYQRWGYQLVGQRTPTPDSPVMDIMWRPRELPGQP
jgi:GNAT superfamily N-acetyltransferase